MDQPEDPGGNGEPQPSETPVYACPQCQAEIRPEGSPAGGLIECPHCGAQFFVSSDHENAPADADAEAEALAARQRREEELSALHIQQVATLRRSLLRTRGHFLVGAALCAGATLMLAGEAAKFGWAAYRTRFAGQPVPKYVLPLLAVLVIAALALLLPARYFLRRAGKIQRELAETRQQEPATPPDFSTLGGDVDPWTKLEQMQRNDPGELELIGRRAKPIPKPPTLPRAARTSSFPTC